MSKLIFLFVLSAIALAHVSVVECASSHSKRDISSAALASLAGGGIG